MATAVEQEIDTQFVMSLDAEYVMRTYGRQKVVFICGQGMKLWDVDGREYLDFLAGIAVNGLGHSHPALVSAIREQVGKLMHVSNLFYVPQQPKLAEQLSELSELSRVFLCNSGAEANETAIKLARKWAKHNLGEDKYEIITAENSFHGRTLAAVAATGQPKYQKGFEPLMPGFKHVPYNDFHALESSITERTCAIMLEPIQGESGVYPAEMEYLTGVRRICDERAILLILDEVQTGLGRTGKWFGYEHYGIKPDIMSLAKTLGGGFPIGACLANECVASAFQPGNHASTFGGNPLACAAALATLNVIKDEKLVENSAVVGEYMKGMLNEMCRRRSDIIEIRGRGLMIGMEMARDDAPSIISKCLSNGLVINAVGQSVIRFLPPLIVTESDVDKAIEILESVL